MSIEIEDGFNPNSSDIREMLLHAAPDGRADNNPNKSSVLVVTLNTINTIVGGGILTLPYTVYQSGLILGISSILVSLFLGIISIRLLIVCKEITGHYCYGSIGYECVGRKSIFLINILIAILCLGLPSSFMIIFADASTPLVQEFFGTESPSVRSWIVVFSGILLLWF